MNTMVELKSATHTMDKKSAICILCTTTAMHNMVGQKSAAHHGWTKSAAYHGWTKKYCCACCS